MPEASRYTLLLLPMLMQTLLVNTDPDASEHGNSTGFSPDQLSTQSLSRGWPCYSYFAKIWFLLILKPLASF